MTAAIRLDAVGKRFGATAALTGIDLAVPPGAFLVLLGPSGCGKTTVLRLLAGLESPSSGAVHMNGRVVADAASGTFIAPDRRGLGMVFQSYALWPHMTAAANVEWPLRVARWTRERRAARVAEVLDLTEIGHLAGRYPAELSGGQQQRVAIARSLAPSPGALLFDEPLAALDARLRMELRSELLRLHRLNGATYVYVTHDQVEALTMATHIAVMNAGRIEQFGTPAELLARPESAFVAGFVGVPPANLIEVERRGQHCVADSVAITASPYGADGSRLTLMYRPEDLRLGERAGHPTVHATLLERAPMAGRTVATVQLGAQRMTLIVETGAITARVGETLIVSLPSRPAAVFGADGRRVEGCD
jgi:iron(III) transport system ATP-binding protein